MATDEDTELRDLLIETLEKRGVLNKIKAELRANVFLALEEQDEFKKKEMHPQQLKDDRLSSGTGRVAVALVQDFLDFFNLKFARNVFDVESSCEGIEKEKACSALGISSGATDQPLLFQLIDTFSERRSDRSPHEVEKQGSGDTRNVSHGFVSGYDSAEKTVPANRTYDVGFDDSAPRETPKQDVASEPEINSTSLELPLETGGSGKMVPSPRAELEDGKHIVQATVPDSLTSLKSLPPLDGFVKPHQQSLGENGSSSLPSDGGDPKQDESKGTGSSRNGSENEESIEEQLDEDTNIDDVLNSSLSLGDMTADHSISQASNLESCDYAETFHQTRR